MANFLNKNFDGDRLKDEMIAILEAKYRKKFSPLLLEPRGFQIDYDKLKFYAEEGNKETDIAHIARFGKKAFEYRDNYFGIHIRSEYEEIITNAAKKVFNSVKVFTKFLAHYFPDELTCQNNFKDSLKLGEKMNAHIYVYVEEENMAANFSNQVTKLIKMFETSNIRGIYYIAHLKKEKFAGVNRTNYQGYTKEGSKKYTEICIESIDGSIPDSTINI